MPVFGGSTTAAATTGPEEGAAANFVHTRYELIAVVAEGLLGRVGALELLQHLQLGRGFGDAGNGRDLEELAHLHHRV